MICDVVENSGEQPTGKIALNLGIGSRQQLEQPAQMNKRNRPGRGHSKPFQHTKQTKVKISQATKNQSYQCEYARVSVIPHYEGRAAFI